MLRLALALALALLLAAAAASPLSLPTLARQQPAPSVVPLPDSGDTTVTPPNAQPSPTVPPPTTLPPATPAAPTAAPPDAQQSPLVTPAVTPGTSPAAAPVPAAAGSPSPSPSPASDDDDDGGGGGLGAGAIIGIIVGALFALAVCIFCIFCCLRRRDRDEQPAVYDQTDAAPPMQPVPPAAGSGGPSEETMSSPYAPDEARNMQPGLPAQDTMDRGMEAAATLPPAAEAGAAAGAGAVAAIIPAGAIKRGPTPPPHDYVLGAGPAATRGDFIDLRAKFERDEIGDNSAVLGVDRTSSATAAPVAGASVDPVEGATGEQSGFSPPPPPPPTMESAFGATEAGGTVSARGADVVDAAEQEVSAPLPPAPPVPPPFAAPVATTYGDTELLPDREDFAGVPTFEAQEKMIAGGDGSGAISDAAMSLNAATIVEETGDVPSLERDPIELSRDRDTTF